MGLSRIQRFAFKSQDYGVGLNGFVVQGQVSGISVSVPAFRMQGVGYLRFVFAVQVCRFTQELKPMQAKTISRDTLL